MIPLLSAAIQSDSSSSRDVLLSAYVGAMEGQDADDYKARGPARYPGRFAHCLLGTYPQLGASVRCWPRLVEELEQKGRIPRAKLNQTRYRREIHVTLWKVLSDLQTQGWAKGKIAELLGRHGL